MKNYRAYESYEFEKIKDSVLINKISDRKATCKTFYDDGIMLNWNQFVTYEELLKLFTFENNEPCGVEITEEIEEKLRCPLCKSENLKENDLIINDQIVDSWLSCQECGIRFNKI